MELEYDVMQTSRQVSAEVSKQVDYCYSRYCSYRAEEVKKRPKDFWGIHLKALSREEFEANIPLPLGRKVDIDKALPKWLELERGYR